MKHIHLLLVVLLCFIASCSSQKELVVKHNNPNISYEGRVAIDTKNGTSLYWPGTVVQIDFEGSEIYAELEDEKGENYFTVIIDGKEASVINTSAGKKTYMLATGLSAGSHRVALFKRTEFSHGETNFHKFIVNNNAKVIENSPKKKRKIEFYGDSITAGYAIDDTSGKDSGAAQFNNNYLAYGALTARYFDAEYRCICKGGIGLMISWFPYTMNDIYERLNPLDSTSTWNFKNYTPDVVVVNIFQNDSWLVNNVKHPEFKRTFGDTPPTKEVIINAYKSFVSNIRKQYPTAEIICALGSMDAMKNNSAWPDYITQATKELNDSKIHTLFFPFKETKGHPSKTEQQSMAERLISYIEKNIKW